MALHLTFTNAQECENFANKHNLTISDDGTIQIGWHLLNHAKNEPAVQQMQTSDTTEHEFIVKCQDVSNLNDLATVVQNLGSGFYLVKSTQAVALSQNVESIEITSLPVTFLGASSPTTADGSVASVDPTDPANQWARLRVATRYRPLKSSFRTHSVVYSSKPEVYIMDSGVDFSHPEFQNTDLEFEDFYTLPAFNGSFVDDVGHGTGVASMVAGKNLGVAANCKLISVKVANATHTPSVYELGLAIDAIIARASADPFKTRLVNMSFAVTRSEYLDHKIQGMIDQGITVVCAAGNQGIDVELLSPAGLNSVITVGSIDKFDIPSGFNNISPSDSGLTTSSGLNLDIFAPGENVVVAQPLSPSKYMTLSGTSISSPLVLGVLAEIASLYTTPLTVTQLKEIMFNTATEHALLFDSDKFSDNQNRLVYLATVDENTNYKNDDMVSYLGVHGPEPTDLIVADLNSVVSPNSLKNLFPDEEFTFGYEFLDPTVAADYAQFMELNPLTGMLQIKKPTIVLPDETKLKMIEFKATVTSAKSKQESHTIFYFDANPLYAETLESDISLALTETNSISFFQNWANTLK